MRQASQQRGSAMIMVVAWTAILMTMSLVVSQAVLDQVRQSDANELSYRALAAAEAGVDDFMARLSGNGTYYAATAAEKATNPAVAGWTSIQGSDGTTSYRYDWAVPSAATSGDLVLKSTGRYLVGDQTVYRTVEARMSKRTSYDYAFFSSLNTQLPIWPNAYKDTSGNSLVDLAVTLCNRYWWTKGQRVSSSTADPWHRNSQFCIFPEITSRNRYYGALHTNDIWYINGSDTVDQPLNRSPLDANVPGQVFNGPLTSSCGQAVGAFSTGEPGCPTTMSWINAADSNLSTTADPGSRKNSYAVDEFTWQSTGIINPTLLKSRLWNPGYAPPIEFPRTFNDAKVNVDVKAQAAAGGCVFTGPTRLRFLSTGQIVVTSPDTKDAGARCGGTSLRYTWWDTPSNDTSNTPPSSTSTARFHNSPTITLPSGFNGVIYIQDVPADTDANGWPSRSVTRAFSVDSTNEKTGNSSETVTRSLAPSCRVKSAAGLFYPFVIPQDEQSDPQFGSGSVNRGFPLEKATGLDIWTEGKKCRQGTLYVEGDFAGRFTLAAEGDIVFTGDLKDPQAKSTYTIPTRPASLAAGYPLIPGDDLTYGRPPATSQNIMGLIPQRMLYFFNPTSTEASGYIKQVNWIINAATISLSECVAVQNYEVSGKLGDLTLVGSLGQNYSCNLTGPGGSRAGGFDTMTVAYDKRYSDLLPPPLFEDIFFAQWEIESTREISGHLQ